MASRMPPAAPGARLPLVQQLQASASARRNPVPPQLLQKYIAYAQLYTAPVLCAEAKEARPPLSMQSSTTYVMDLVSTTLLTFMAYLAVDCMWHFCGNIECVLAPC